MNEQAGIQWMHDRLAELESELAGLDSKIADLEQRRATLRQALEAGHAFLKVQPGFESRDVAVTGDFTASATLSGTATVTPGLRSCIISVLGEAQALMSPSEIAEEIDRLGYGGNAKTRLSTRVSNELGRLETDKQVVREGRALWRLVKPEEAQMHDEQEETA